MCIYIAFSLRNRVHFYVVVNVMFCGSDFLIANNEMLTDFKARIDFAFYCIFCESVYLGFFFLDFFLVIGICCLSLC